ncbi:MAG: hypothetical protein FWG05_03495, partial [Kiritimatiellaeota bacterium]|nr:hypothetical protein [Kiritimatiellota bacterium]
SRGGCIVPAVVLMLMRESKTADEIDALLNKKSGLTGVGGINSGDMRDITGAAASGTASAQLAYEMWVHRILLYIGGYAAVLGNVDAIVFTGGIGENHRAARHKLVSQFGFFGATLDENANAAKNGPCHISTPESKTAVIVIPTDEELMIAQETLAAVKNHAQ